MFIKASRETHSGELVLIVRPNGETDPARSAGKMAHSSAWCITVVEGSAKFPFGLGCVYWTLAINEGKSSGEKVTASNRKGYGRVKRKRGKEKNRPFSSFKFELMEHCLFFLFLKFILRQHFTAQMVWMLATVMQLLWVSWTGHPCQNHDCFMTKSLLIKAFQVWCDNFLRVVHFCSSFSDHD